MKPHAFACLIALSLGLSIAQADVRLGPIFTDHAVLQRDKPLQIWGSADSGEKVQVEFAGREATTVADVTGKWRVLLPALPASDQPSTLVVRGKNTWSRTDMVVGEVWLASGQSNMEWTVSRSDRAEDEIAAARLPGIRHLKIVKKVSSEPLDTAEGAWRVASPETAGGFTAAGYFFARDLHRELGVPIGIVHSSWGGTPIEAWLPPATLGSDPDFEVVNERWAKTLADYPARKIEHEARVAAWNAEAAAAKAKGEAFTKTKPRAPSGPGHQNTPTGLYNGMIHPLSPFAFRGVIWYQGEANGGRALEYRKLFPAMITGWRRAFGRDDLSFYWVQLANYNAGDAQGTAWAFLREAQDRTLSLPSTGQAVAIDIGNPKDIHPTNKQEVGRRLALIALAKDYGRPVEFSGPRFVAAKVERSQVRVTFTEARGLHSRGPAPELFEIAGSDRVFVPAEARIEGEAVVVSSPKVSVPFAVRYAWRHSPAATLYNAAGLPAVPFRSDDW